MNGKRRQLLIVVIAAVSASLGLLVGAGGAATKPTLIGTWKGEGLVTDVGNSAPFYDQLTVKVTRLSADPRSATLRLNRSGNPAVFCTVNLHLAKTRLFDRAGTKAYDFDRDKSQKLDTRYCPHNPWPYYLITFNPNRPQMMVMAGADTRAPRIWGLQATLHRVR